MPQGLIGEPVVRSVQSSLSRSVDLKPLPPRRDEPIPEASEPEATKSDEALPEAAETIQEEGPTEKAIESGALPKRRGRRAAAGQASDAADRPKKPRSPRKEKEPETLNDKFKLICLQIGEDGNLLASDE